MDTTVQSPPSPQHDTNSLPHHTTKDALDSNHISITGPAAAAAALTPPTSEDMDSKHHTLDSSDLSDLEDDSAEQEEPIEPDHYYGGGKVPVFKPTMDQFRDFKRFCERIDHYGMKSGIVKVIPPKEWRDSLHDLDEQVKSIRIKNPIMQEFTGAHGTWTQANIEKQRSYNLPEWKSLTEEPSNQCPARRGERRKNQEKPVRGGLTRGRGLGRSRRSAPATATATQDVGDSLASDVVPSVEDKSTKSKASTKKVRGRTKAPANGSSSVSSRRMNNRSERAEIIDESAFQDFDYRLDNLDEFTPERCAELETAYWKSLTFAAPMYAADMPGSLFTDDIASWNVAKLENLLDVLGTKVPGVNTAYLYLGMWKATFAWHLEDVDLYSINYIHFGAPKQWYSISQEDARKFEAAMRHVWPNDSKHCDQFLRHKTYLISPALLKERYNITVNKLVHHEGEFVITYPYGYHSGYNLGYNCAESVNFALESWLDYGKIARKCECESDSVWVDVYDIERKLRGEATPEYIEETDVDDDDIEEQLLTPPASVTGKTKSTSRKRKRDSKVKEEEAAPPKKRLRLKIRAPTREACMLCPNDALYEPLMSTDSGDGKKAHRSCVLYTPETWIELVDGREIARGVMTIDKARLVLKCNFCRSRHGACFQCAHKKCTRAYHATCALPAGVQIDMGPVPTFGEDGTEYYEEGFDFRCRFHRPKRTKAATSDGLETNKLIHNFAQVVTKGDCVQAQYPGQEIFAGVVVDNRHSEMSLLMDVQPEGDRVEVEWKWLVVLDPKDSLRPKPSSHAVPMPKDMTKQCVSIGNRQDGIPTVDDQFHDCEGNKWAEFTNLDLPPGGHEIGVLDNNEQVKVSITSNENIFYYLPKQSTETKPRFSDHPRSQQVSAKADFLTVVQPVKSATLAKATKKPSVAAAAKVPVSKSSLPQGPDTRMPKDISTGLHNDHVSAAHIQSFPLKSDCIRVGGSATSSMAITSTEIGQGRPSGQFPLDAYYSTNVLPAAFPGGYSQYVQHVRQNSSSSTGRRPSFVHERPTWKEAVMDDSAAHGTPSMAPLVPAGLGMQQRRLSSLGHAAAAVSSADGSGSWTPPSKVFESYGLDRTLPMPEDARSVDHSIAARQQGTHESMSEFKRHVAQNSAAGSALEQHYAQSLGSTMQHRNPAYNNPAFQAQGKSTPVGAHSPQQPIVSPLSSTQVTPEARKAELAVSAGPWHDENVP